MELKTTSISVRLSPSEKLQLLSNANKLDINLSQLIKILTMIEPEDILRIHNKDLIIVNNKTEIHGLNKEINRIGTNINQCAKAFNTLMRFYKLSNNNIDKDMQELFNNITENSLLELYKNIESLKSEINKIENKLVIKRTTEL